MLLNETGAIALQSLACGLLISYTVFIFYTQCTRRVQAPRIGKTPWLACINGAKKVFLKNGKDLTRDGYARYKNSMYWVQTCDMDRLVLSNRYVDELRKLPDSISNSRLAVVERNLGWYNGVDIILKSTTHVDVCRTQLVQNLGASAQAARSTVAVFAHSIAGKVTGEQIQGLDAMLRTELADCFEDHSDTFHFHNAFEAILNITNRTMARTLVGEPLCHDETWLRTSLENTVHTGLLCQNLQRYPRVLRGMICPLTQARKKLDESFATALRLLTPIASSRSRSGTEHVDILQWLIQSSRSASLDLDFLTKQTLFLATASTRSTAASIVNTLYDLLEHRDCQEELREEISECVSSHGWSLHALQAMRKLDSFVKESQRLNHQLLLSLNRKITRHVTLRDGLTLPAGTFVCTPAYWVARDPEIFEGGVDFRPWRWFHLLEAAEREGKSTTQYLSSSTSADNLHWGYGRNACPGRFMAAMEIKLLLAWMLHHFDIVFPSGQTLRPQSAFVDERIVPSRTQEIGFRRRARRAEK